MVHDDFVRRCGIPSDIVEHLPFLYGIGLGHTVIELGVRSGNSTSAFLAAGAELWSVDIDRPRVPDEWHTTGWTFIQGDDCSPEVLAQLPAEVDVVFIDTSHSYEHTLRELNTYAPRVKHRGLIVLHDTELEAPDGLPGEPPYPVKRAVTEWCAQHGLSWENRPACNGLGVIRVDRPER